MNTAVPTIEELYSLGIKIGELVRRLYLGTGSMELEFKSDDTPLTIADRMVSKLVGEWRDELFPNLIVISEEGHSGVLTGDPDECHLRVDEIDGTWAYMLGVPVFSSLLALIKGADVVAACIVDPISYRIYTAELNNGAFLNKKRIQVCQELPKTPSVGIVAWPERENANSMLVKNMISGPGGGVAGKLHDIGWSPLKMGTIGYVDAMVADGRLVATIFPGGTLHDTAAGDLLVREAGGITSDLKGDILQYDGMSVHGHIFACNRKVHMRMLQTVIANG